MQRNTKCSWPEDVAGGQCPLEDRERWEPFALRVRNCAGPGPGENNQNIRQLIGVPAQGHLLELRRLINSGRMPIETVWQQSMR